MSLTRSPGLQAKVVMDFRYVFHFHISSTHAPYLPDMLLARIGSDPRKAEGDPAIAISGLGQFDLGSSMH